MTEIVVVLGHPWYVPFLFALLGYLGSKLARRLHPHKGA